jgi:ankyrin repeat protein
MRNENSLQGTTKRLLQGSRAVAHRPLFIGFSAPLATRWHGGHHQSSLAGTLQPLDTSSHNIPPLPLEILQMVARRLRHADGKLRFPDFSAFIQANRVLYVSLSRTLWHEAAHDPVTTERAMTHLIKKNDLSALEIFLELGADIETILPTFIQANTGLHRAEGKAWGPIASTALVAAADRDNVELATLLLRKGATVQSGPRYSVCRGGPFHAGRPRWAGFCPLHAARSAAMVRLLLDHGADPGVEDNQRFQPLHWCAFRNDIDAMAALISGGAKLRRNWLTWGTDALHEAATASVQAVQLLLDSGADPNRTDCNGRTPLHSAALSGQIDVVQFWLRRWPLSVHEKDFNRDTPLHLAAQQRRSAVVSLLVISWPQGRMARNFYGNTPLHYAMMWSSSREVRHLLKEGCSEVKSVRNFMGHKPGQLKALRWGADQPDFGSTMRWHV